MKVKVEKIKGFTPLKLVIDIETKDELHYMWHITNNLLEESRCDDSVPVPHDLRNIFFLWAALDEKVKEFNEKTA